MPWPNDMINLDDELTPGLSNQVFLSVLARFNQLFFQIPSKLEVEIYLNVPVG